MYKNWLQIKADKHLWNSDDRRGTKPTDGLAGGAATALLGSASGSRGCDPSRIVPNSQGHCLSNTNALHRVWSQSTPLLREWCSTICSTNVALHRFRKWRDIICEDDRITRPIPDMIKVSPDDSIVLEFDLVGQWSLVFVNLSLSPSLSATKVFHKHRVPDVFECCTACLS